jgi:hypothetical protein
MSLRLYLSYVRWFFLVVSGLKTNTVRFWKATTIRQFERARDSGNLVRLGGMSRNSCWGYARIVLLSAYCLSDVPLHILACDSVGRDGPFASVSDFLRQEFASAVRKQGLQAILDRTCTSVSFRFVRLASTFSRGGKIFDIREVGKFLIYFTV